MVKISRVSSDQRNSKRLMQHKAKIKDRFKYESKQIIFSLNYVGDHFLWKDNFTQFLMHFCNSEKMNTGQSTESCQVIKVVCNLLHSSRKIFFPLYCNYLNSIFCLTAIKGHICCVILDLLKMFLIKTFTRYIYLVMKVYEFI